KFGQGHGVFGSTEAVAGVDDAQLERFVIEVTLAEQGGEGGQGGIDRGVVDGEGGFAHEVGIGVVEEVGDAGLVEAAIRENDAEAHGGGGIVFGGGEGDAVVDAHECVGRGVADVGIGVVVGAQQIDERGGGRRITEFAERLGG